MAWILDHLSAPHLTGDQVYLLQKHDFCDTYRTGVPVEKPPVDTGIAKPMSATRESNPLNYNLNVANFTKQHVKVVSVELEEGLNVKRYCDYK